MAEKISAYKSIDGQIYGTVEECIGADMYCKQRSKIFTKPQCIQIMKNNLFIRLFYKELDGMKNGTGTVSLSYKD